MAEDQVTLAVDQLQEMKGQQEATVQPVLENGGQEGADADAEGDAQQQDGDKKKSKKDKRKEKKQKQKLNKQLRRRQQDGSQQANGGTAPSGADTGTEAADEENIVIEYVSAPLELEQLSLGESAQPESEDQLGAGLGFNNNQEDPFADFKRVFAKFATAEQVTGAEPLPGDTEATDQGAAAGERADNKPSTTDTGAEDSDEEDEEGKAGKLSRKQRKILNQMKIVQLKQVCERPDVVEIWDVTAQDPQLLVFLKAYRNSVPVPRHWSQKRKYLQGKRGIEKPPFKLPDFIEATGIGEMRQAYQEKEDAKKLKQKQRERMQPKMGRMDIDYQVLHDAFFKHQTKPKLTQMGEMYYEGKEYEAHVEGLKPGVLSAELRNALGMTDNTPPPWLINMQRYGPPPSYPNLRVPGLNAPIPAGCQFGYQQGGWGKPPVDEQGVPLYGDVFGQHVDEADSDEEVDKANKWGEVEELEESEEEEEEEEEEEQPDEEALADGIASGIASGMVSGMVSGLTSGIASSLPSGIETPDVSINLRKGNESVEAPRLYTVLEQKAAPIGQGTILGTDHVYVMPGQGAAKKAGIPGRPGLTDVEVTLSPEEMEGLDEADIKKLYDAKVAEARAEHRREDFSDLVAAKAAQQKRKMQQKTDTAKKQKTGKDFKF